MKQKTALVMSMFVLAVLLSGCAKLLITTSILPDGSGTNEVIFALDTYQVPPGNIFWTSVNLNRRALEEEGAKVTSWQDGSYQGFKAIFSFEDLNEMEMQLTAQDLGESYEYGNSALRIVFLDVNAWFDENDKLHFVANGDRTSAMELGSDNVFTLVMPGRIISYSEEDVAELPLSNIIVYDLTKFDGRAFQIDVVSDVSIFGYLSWAWWIILCLCIFIVVVVVIIILIVRYRRRKSIYDGDVAA
jgi:hypothetical protein